MARLRPELVFEAKVDYSGDRSLDKGNQEGPIEEVVVKTLTVELPEELERIFGLKTTVHVKRTRYGSLSVFFAVVLTTYSILSGYKGLFESMELIRDQAEALLEAALRRWGGFNVNVRALHPSRESLRWPGRLSPRGIPEWEDDLLPPHAIFAARQERLTLLVLLVCLSILALLCYEIVLRHYF